MYQYKEHELRNQKIWLPNPDIAKNPWIDHMRSLNLIYFEDILFEKISNNLNFYLKELEKEEQSKLQTSKRKEIINIREEINDVEP